MSFNTTAGLLAGYGAYDQMERNTAAGQDMYNGTQYLADEAQAGTEFKPFTVTAGGGTAQAGANGDLTLTHSPEQQAFIDQLTGGSQGFFSDATGSTADREAQVYEAIRATQRPEEERAQLALEGRQAAQGRGGITSSMYGGTPEQLAMNKAIQESQNSASLMALQQAKADQMQNATLGGMFQNASYMPQAQLLNALNPSLNIANMGQTGQIAGQNLATQLGLGGLQGQLNAEVANSNLMGGLFTNLSQAASNGGFDPIGGALDWLWSQTPWGG